MHEAVRTGARDYERLECTQHHVTNTAWQADHQDHRDAAGQTAEGWARRAHRCL